MLNFQLLPRIFRGSKFLEPATFNTDICSLVLVHYADNSHHSCGGPTFEKKRYAMCTCVCYLEIQRSRGKEGSARYANEGQLGFVSVVLGFHCRRWKERYVMEFFRFLKFVMNLLKGVVSMSQVSKYGSTWLHSFAIFTLTFSILILLTTC